MSDRPITFNAPMVRALFDGRKTQTRRIMKSQPRRMANVFQDGEYWYEEAKIGPGSDCIIFDCVEPGYAVGDRLWVQEEKQMPRWASRLTLIVTDVRVQRLHEISAWDALCEGVRKEVHGGACFIEGFQNLWSSIYGPDAWDANPWVVALTFDVVRKNIDEMEVTG